MRRGFGDLDCSNLSYPPDPNYANCSPLDAGCVNANGALNQQHNIDVQAYHDAMSACSAQKWVASGGTLTPTALTYGAAQDLITNSQTASPTPPSAMAIPTQVQQLAAYSAPVSAVPPAPAPSTPVPPTPTPSSSTSAAPSTPVVSSGVPPTPPTTTTSAADPLTFVKAPPPTGPIVAGFDLSQIPWWGWAGAGIGALFLLGSKR